MINTINILDMFFESVVYVLAEIIEPSLYRMSDKQVSTCRLVFLHQLFNTWRIFNVTHDRVIN